MSSKSAKAKTDKSEKKKENPAIVKGYLIAYNVAQTLGWSYLLYQFITHSLFSSSSEHLYDHVKWTVIVFQNAALLEVVHAVTGIVPSNAIITLVQVLSRVMLVCGVLMPAPPSRDSIGFQLCLTAWSLTEIIRYGMYAVNLLGVTPYFLVWLRYTLFIALYPIGITGELLCLYTAQNYVAETGLWSYELPNQVNFTFSYRYFIIVVMLSYIPVFPQLYLHMFAQRKKVLGGASASAGSPKSSSKAKIDTDTVTDLTNNNNNNDKKTDEHTVSVTVVDELDEHKTDIELEHPREI